MAGGLGARARGASPASEVRRRDGRPGEGRAPSWPGQAHGPRTGGRAPRPRHVPRDRLGHRGRLLRRGKPPHRPSARELHLRPGRSRRPPGGGRRRRLHGPGRRGGRLHLGQDGRGGADGARAAASPRPARGRHGGRRLGQDHRDRGPHLREPGHRLGARGREPRDGSRRRPRARLDRGARVRAARDEPLLGAGAGHLAGVRGGGRRWWPGSERRSTRRNSAAPTCTPASARSTRWSIPRRKRSTTPAASSPTCPGRCTSCRRGARPTTTRRGARNGSSGRSRATAARSTACARSSRRWRTAARSSRSARRGGVPSSPGSPGWTDGPSRSSRETPTSTAGRGRRTPPSR